MNMKSIPQILLMLLIMAVVSLLVNVGLRQFEEPPITRAQADALLTELARLRQGGGRQPGPPPAPQVLKVATAGLPLLGNPKAPLTLVEFTDFDCPFCRRFALQTLPALKEKYIDTGKLKLLMVDLPLPSHPEAPMKSEASHCAGDQGKYYEMHDEIFKSPTKLSADGLREAAKNLGLNMATYDRCMKEGTHKARVAKGLETSRQLGMTGTPSFILGPSGDEVEGPKIVGAQPLERFEAAIEAMLKEL